MKLLPTQEVLKQLLTYNPMTGELHWKTRPKEMFESERIFKSWNARYAGQPAFTATDAKGYLVGAINSISCRAARVIYKLHHGIDAEQVDHEDHDRKNNRISNLKNVSGLYNQKNMSKAKNNTSGTTGVCWSKQKEKWQARIKVKSKTIFIGYFDQLDDAIKARKQAERSHDFHPNHGT